MSKQLIVAFTAEGSTDEAFLGSIISRTLTEIAYQNDLRFDVEEFIWLGASKGQSTLQKIIDAYEQTGSQLIIIHRDTDQHSRQDILNHHFSPLIDKLPESVRNGISIIPLIIRHEQETWLFADLDALDEQLEGRLDRHSLNLPPDIESRANAKELFKKTLREASKVKGGRRGYNEDTVIEALANTIRLSQLANLPSYQQFVMDMETALSQINYIR